MAASVSVAGDNPRSWLMRMAQAVEQLNYQGTLVHMHGGAADILRIVHRVEGGRISERITALDGPGREIIRNNDEVTCILPDQGIVMIELRDVRDRKQSPLQGHLPQLDNFDERLYRLSFKDEDSVAGRRARVVEVEPSDDYRYGYLLWLDSENAMPLKSQLRDEHGTVIEQILFTEIVLAQHIAATELEPSLSMDKLTLQRATSADAAEIAASGPASHAGWAVTELPDGFMQIATHAKFVPGSTLPMEQLVYSDGLASVSVFIEADVGTDEQAEGWSGMGAANAYTTMRDGFLITAVGEVPMRTVRLMAHATQPVLAAD
jgi:sigma-E factor negative regulatory protein RseB